MTIMTLLGSLDSHAIFRRGEASLPYNFFMSAHLGSYALFAIFAHNLTVGNVARLLLELLLSSCYLASYMRYGKTDSRRRTTVVAASLSTAGGLRCNCKTLNTRRRY